MRATVLLLLVSGVVLTLLPTALRVVAIGLYLVNHAVVWVAGAVDDTLDALVDGLRTALRRGTR